jgi:tripartite-type tricarboxylate transporter receptor subunit TctC
MNVFASPAAGLLAALALVAISTGAAGQTWPTRPIRLVVGFAPGGNTDLIARVFAGGIAKSLGQPLVVENRPGAGGAIAREFVAKAAPDGYTLISDATGLATSMVFFKNPPLDVQKAFAPLSLLTESMGTLVTNGDAPFSTFPEMVAWARKNPGRLNWAGVGLGTSTLNFLAMKAQYGIDIVSVEYKSSSDTYRAILSGEAQLASQTVYRVAADVAAGKVKALAATMPQRHPLLPNVPTSKELGLTAYVSWQGLWAPAGTPAPIVRAINAAVREAVRQKDVVDGLDKLEAVVIASSPEALAERISGGIRDWRELIAKAGLQLE